MPTTLPEFSNCCDLPEQPYEKKEEDLRFTEGSGRLGKAVTWPKSPREGPGGLLEPAVAPKRWRRWQYGHEA